MLLVFAVVKTIPGMLRFLRLSPLAGAAGLRPAALAARLLPTAPLMQVRALAPSVPVTGLRLASAAAAPSGKKTGGSGRSGRSGAGGARGRPKSKEGLQPATLRSVRIALRKRFGQHLLKNADVVKRIVEASHASGRARQDCRTPVSSSARHEPE